MGDATELTRERTPGNLLLCVQGFAHPNAVLLPVFPTARLLERAGIPRNVAMSISGHRTEQVYRRYDLVNSRDLQAAVARMERFLSGERPRPYEKGRRNLAGGAG